MAQTLGRRRPREQQLCEVQKWRCLAGFDERFNLVDAPKAVVFKGASFWLFRRARFFARRLFPRRLLVLRRAELDGVELALEVAEFVLQLVEGAEHDVFDGHLAQRLDLEEKCLAPFSENP